MKYKLEHIDQCVCIIDTELYRVVYHTFGFRENVDAYEPMVELLNQEYQQWQSSRLTKHSPNEVKAYENHQGWAWLFWTRGGRWGAYDYYGKGYRDLEHAVDHVTEKVIKKMVVEYDLQRDAFLIELRADVRRYIECLAEGY